MIIQIEIDEQRITNLVEIEIVNQIIEKNYSEHRIGLKTGIEKGIKEYIYKNKSEIIDRVVNRAAAEIVKKGLPKLLSELGKV